MKDTFSEKMGELDWATLISLGIAPVVMISLAVTVPQPAEMVDMANIMN